MHQVKRNPVHSSIFALSDKTVDICLRVLTLHDISLGFRVRALNLGRSNAMKTSRTYGSSLHV